jgi:hypothetical protein
MSTIKPDSLFASAYSSTLETQSVHLSLMAFQRKGKGSRRLGVKEHLTRSLSPLLDGLKNKNFRSSDRIYKAVFKKANEM